MKMNVVFVAETALPYRNCDSLCYNPTVNSDGTLNHSTCQEEELLQIPTTVQYDPETGNQTILPFEVEKAVLQFQELHRRMATRRVGLPFWSFKDAYRSGFYCESGHPRC